MQQYYAELFLKNLIFESERFFGMNKRMKKLRYENVTKNAQPTPTGGLY